jgi:hypothetical protein
MAIRRGKARPRGTFTGSSAAVGRPLLQRLAPLGCLLCAGIANLARVQAAVVVVGTGPSAVEPSAAGAATAASTNAVQQAASTAPEEALGEGPLGNRSLVDVHPAWESLLEGDAAWRRSRETDGARSGLDLAEAFEAWRRTLEEAESSAALPWVDPRRTPDGAWDPLFARSFEGPDTAVERRLDLLDEAERRAWRERFEGLASETSGSDPERARKSPGTAAAARAWLRAADRALAAGRRAHAWTYAERAQRTANWLADEPLEQAAAARLAAGARAPEGPPPGTPGAEADRLELLGTTDLEDPLMGAGALPGSPPGRGLIPDGTFLADGRLAVQLPSRVVLVDPTTRGVDVAVEGAVRIQEALGPPALPFPGLGEPGWWLRPATDGRTLAWVEGRRRPGEGTGNALAVWTPPEPRQPDAIAPRSLQTVSGRWHWALRGDERWDFEAPVERVPELAPLVAAEWQGGPVVAGDTLIAAARTGDDERRTWLAGFGLRLGDLRWLVPVDRGSERRPATARFGGGRESYGASAPLAERDGRVLLVSHLGTASLFDAVDGRRLWTVRLRRAPDDQLTWTGTRALLGGRHVLVAAADSDRLYRLPNGPLDAAVPEAPLHRSGGIALFAAEWVEGAARAAWVQARFGPAPTVRRFDLETGAWNDTNDLLTESWSDGAELWGARVLAVTDRSLSLFEAGGDLNLRDQLRLPQVPTRGFGARRRGGPLVLRADLAVVVEADRLVWVALGR